MFSVFQAAIGAALAVLSWFGQTPGTLPAGPPDSGRPAGCTVTQPVDEVEAAFLAAFTVRYGDCVGWWSVRMIRCEAHNPAGNYDPAFISPTGDAGPAQINQIHGRPGGIIEGRWPEAVQTVPGNIAAALELYRQSGTQPWANSGHCWRT